MCVWSTIKRHVEVASHSDEAGQRQDNIKESTRNETERDRHSSALPFRTLYLGKEPSTESDAADSDAQQKEKTKKTMALDGGGDEWRVAADGEATIGGDAWWESDEPDTLGHGQEIDDLVGGGEWRRGAPQAVLDNVAMEEEIGGAVQEMWTKGGGREGYEEIGRNEIARDPVLRLYLRSDEAEGAIRSAPQERLRDREGENEIVMDESECRTMRERGTSTTWRARDLACRLHKWHHFTAAAATDASLKKTRDGRLASFGGWEGVQPKEGDDDAQETRAQIHERIGRGIWGGALPGSWEIVDAEMYAIYSFLRTKADETETTLQPHRCLVMSDSETALKEIERAYRGRTRGETNRSALNAAVQAQIDIIQRHRGYVIFIFTEGHAGNAPNSMADAAAKAHLRSRVTSAYTDGPSTTRDEQGMHLHA